MKSFFFREAVVIYRKISLTKPELINSKIILMVSGANEHQFATLLQFQSQISTHFQLIV